MESSSIAYSILLGIIQGITEFLPVSSSAHLILISSMVNGKALPMFLNVSLHFGTLLAVLIYFFDDWWKILKGLKLFIINKQKTYEQQVLLPALIMGSVPAGVVGLLWKDPIEEFFHNPKSVILPLILVGLLLWLVDKKSRTNRSLKSLTITDGIKIGLAQVCALIPGVSRSGATIVAARALSFKREDAARFSFLLGTPAMGGAALLHARGFIENIGNPAFIVGIITSCVVGLGAIKFFISFINRFGFFAFALYRTLLAFVVAYVLF